MKAKNWKSVRELAMGKRDMYSYDPAFIKVRIGWNVREQTAELDAADDELFASIRDHGYDQSKALTIYRDGEDLYLTDGHRRHKAVMRARAAGVDIKSVPCLMEERGMSEPDRVAGMLTRNNGVHLTMLEQCKVAKLLINHGWNDEQIAKAAGKTVAYVRTMLLPLMEAAPETKAAVTAGHVAASTVAKAVREHGPTKGAEVVARAVRSNSVAGRRVTAKDVDRAAGKAMPPSRDDLALAAECLERWKAFVVLNGLDDDEIGCSMGELDGLIAKLGRKELVAA